MRGKSSPWTQIPKIAMYEILTQYEDYEATFCPSIPGSIR
jgi:hypothetical protein